MASPGLWLTLKRRARMSDADQNVLARRPLSFSMASPRDPSARTVTMSIKHMRIYRILPLIPFCGSAGGGQQHRQNGGGYNDLYC